MIPCGFNIISPRIEGMHLDEMIALYQVGNFDLVKLQIEHDFSTDPADVTRFLEETNVKTVILRTADDMRGYDYQHVRDLVEGPGGISGYSYASLMAAHPSISWVLEIGNEYDHPNLRLNPWVVRWWALAIYKELALNWLGHIDQPWREKYPMLKWAISAPMQFANLKILTQWQDTQGADQVGDGGVLDYFDSVGIHIYGHFDLWDADDADWVRSYNYLASNPYCKELLVTEAGINDAKTPDYVKARRYREFIETAHPKVKGVAIWTLGRGTQFPTYELSRPEVMQIIGGREE